MVIVNESGDIVLVNSQTEKMFGHVRNELLGQKVEMLLPEVFHGIHPSHREEFFRHAHARSMGVGLGFMP